MAILVPSLLGKAAIKLIVLSHINTIIIIPLENLNINF